MGRVLVKSALPGKVLVKFDDDYEYAYDANNNLVLVQSPKLRGRPTTRGERVASVVGNVAGVGRSLLQPANTFSQFLSNLRTGAQLGGQDVRGLYRNFLETRGARRRAENRQAAADKRARQDELFRQAVKRKQIGLRVPRSRLGYTTREQRQNALDELRAAQDTAGQRRKEMEELGERLARDAEPTGQDPSDFYGSMKQIVGQVPHMAGDSGRIDVPQIALPPPTEQQRDDLLTQLQTATAPRPVGPVIDKPMPGTLSKPSGKVKVVNAAGEVNNMTPEEITPVVNNIQRPPQGYEEAANSEASGTPAPNTAANTTMDKFNQMKPEPVKEEEEEEPSMLSNIQAKMRGYTPGAEA